MKKSSKKNIYTEPLGGSLHELAKTLIMWQKNLLDGRVFPNDVGVSLKKLEASEFVGDSCCPPDDAVIRDSFEYRDTIKKINDVLSELFCLSDIGYVKNLVSSSKDKIY